MSATVVKAPEAKPLPFPAAGLRGLSERLIESHHRNNYGGAVKRLAAIRAQLAALDAALYGGGALDGKAFWRAVRPWVRRNPARRAAAVPPALPPLFRLQARGGRGAQ